MTFKVGDKVRVRLDAKKYTEAACGWTSGMDKTYRKTGVVKEICITEGRNTVKVFFEKPIGCDYWYSKDSLEKLTNEDKQVDTKLNLEVGKEYVEEKGGQFFIVADCRKFFSYDPYPFIAYYFSKIYQFSEEGISKCGQLQLIKECREPINHKKTFWVTFNPRNKPNDFCILDKLTGFDTDNNLHEEREAALSSVNKFKSCLARVEVTVTEEPIETEKETASNSTSVDLPKTETAPHLFRIDLGEA